MAPPLGSHVLHRRLGIFGMEHPQELVTNFRKNVDVYLYISKYSKTCLKRPLKKKTKIWFSKPVIAKCRSKVLQSALLEHSAILSTFIKLPIAIKIFVLSFFLSGRLIKTGFTVYAYYLF